MNLQFHAPLVKKGEKFVQLNQEDTAEGIKKWK